MDDRVTHIELVWKRSGDTCPRLLRGHALYLWHDGGRQGVALDVSLDHVSLRARQLVRREGVVGRTGEVKGTQEVARHGSTPGGNVRDMHAEALLQKLKHARVIKHFAYHHVAPRPGGDDQERHSKPHSNRSGDVCQDICVDLALRGHRGNSFCGAEWGCGTPCMVVELAAFVVVENEGRLRIVLRKLAQCFQYTGCEVLPCAWMIRRVL
mmetsp:Transcript_26317/g.43933  ORF Transcript_26317/g.43933 Transcript_26317/m.43933 type:complete len:210 (+) Transcript_26317:556-1185(+)